MRSPCPTEASSGGSVVFSCRERAMGDDSLKREVWEGKIPVCFRVADEEVVLILTGERTVPEPCYVSCVYNHNERTLG